MTFSSGRVHAKASLRGYEMFLFLAFGPPCDVIWKILNDIDRDQQTPRVGIEKSSHAPLVSKSRAVGHGQLAAPTGQELSAIFGRPFQQSQRARWLTSTAAARTISCR
jgi:hypothetical protein